MDASGMADNNGMSGAILPDMLASHVWADAGIHHVKSLHTIHHMQKSLTSRTDTSKVPPPRSKTRMVSLLFFSKP